MKISWVQVLVSILIGLLIGLNVNSLGFHNCKGCLHKHGCHQSSWKHHGKHNCKSCKKDKKHFMMEHFSKKLNLTPEQQSKLSAIMDEKHKKMIALRNEIRPQFIELRKSTQSEIKSILTVEQQKKFDEIHTKWKAKREKWHEKSEE